ncbi:MAG: hypothetical protein JNM80_15520 [Phycisphaerae bacterium]|nr:hypothetical protein [Phycisphaerae bacterium]
MLAGIEGGGARGQQVGPIVGWGNNSNGQSEPPPELDREYRAVSAGHQHSVAIRADGSLVAWGDTFFGQSPVPENLRYSKYKAISAGYIHSLAVIDHPGFPDHETVVAWGYNFFGACDIPVELQGQAVLAIAAGENVSFAIRKSDGKLFAWGQGATCGDSVPTCQCPPGQWNPTDIGLSPELNVGFAAIAATGHYAIAQRNDKTLHVWGANDACQVTTAPLGVCDSFTAGHKHGIVIRPTVSSSAEFFGWGHSLYGQERTVAIPCPPNCGVCFGTTCYKPPPSPFPSVLTFARFKGGYYHTTGQRSNGWLVAWGNNEYNQCNVPAGAFFDFSANYYACLAIETLSDTDAYANADGGSGSPRFSLSDIAAFNGRLGAGDSRADCNGDGQLTVSDLTCFLWRFERARRMHPN